MKTAALLLTIGLILCTHAQEIRGLGSGSSHSGPWNRHTLRVPRGSFDAAGKSIREVFPLALFKDRIEITYSFSQEVNQEQIRPQLLEFTADFLSAEPKIKYLSSDESKQLASENDLLIDCKVAIAFHFHDRRELVALIDSSKRLALVNYSGGSGLVRY